MAAKIEGGCTLWARKTFESDIFFLKPDKWFKIWFYIVGKVNHRDNKQFKRSEGYFKYEWIMTDCKATRNEVDHFIRWAKSATQIATRKATRGFYITVLNYHLYQNMSVYKSDTESDSKSEVKAIQKRHSLNKNDNNGIKEEPKSNVPTMQGSMPVTKEVDPIDQALTQLLITLMERNYPESTVLRKLRSENRQKDWMNTCRLLRKVDKRTPDEIKRVIVFSQGDEFWKDNVMSMTKVRKNWDLLWAKSKKSITSIVDDGSGWIDKMNKKQKGKKL